MLQPATRCSEALGHVWEDHGDAGARLPPLPLPSPGPCRSFRRYHGQEGLGVRLSASCPLSGEHAGMVSNVPWTRREEREPHATHLLPEVCALLATPGKLAGWELRTPERGAVLKDSE